LKRICESIWTITKNHCMMHGKKNVKLCIYLFQNVFLRCPTPRLHCFLSSHCPSFRFLWFMVFFIPSIQFFFRSSSCSLLFWHPLQCYLGHSSFCHSLKIAVPCELVLFDLRLNLNTQKHCEYL